MKTRFFVTILAVSLLSLMMTACSKDDDNPSVEEMVLGTWVVEHYDITGKDAPNLTIDIDRLVLFAEKLPSGETRHTYQLFTPDGNSLEGTYEAGDNFLRFDYVINGNDETEYTLFEISSITAQQLILVYRDTSGADIALTFTLRKKP